MSKRNPNPFGSSKWLREMQKARREVTKTNAFKEAVKDQKRRNKEMIRNSKANRTMQIRQQRADNQHRQYVDQTERMDKAGKIEMVKAIGNQFAKNLVPGTTTYGASAGINAMNNLITNNSEIADKNITKRKDDEEQEEATGALGF